MCVSACSTCVRASIRLATTLSRSSVRMRCSVALLSLSLRSRKNPESFSSGEGGALWSSKFSTGILDSPTNYGLFKSGSPIRLKPSNKWLPTCCIDLIMIYCLYKWLHIEDVNRRRINGSLQNDYHINLCMPTETSII